MSEIEKKWDDFSQDEKKKAYKELDQLLRIQEQKKKAKDISIQERIKKIKIDFPIKGN